MGLRGLVRDGLHRLGVGLVSWPWAAVTPVAVGLLEGSLSLIAGAPVARWLVLLSGWVAAVCLVADRATGGGARRGQVVTVVSVFCAIAGVGVASAEPGMVVSAAAGAVVMAGPWWAARRTRRGPGLSAGEATAAVVLGVMVGMVDLRWALATAAGSVLMITIARGPARLHRAPPRVGLWLVVLPFVVDLVLAVLVGHQWFELVGAPAHG